MSCGVGFGHGSDLALLWLWHRPVVAALIQPLAWELPYATGELLKRKKKTLQIQCNPHQIAQDIFHRTKINNLKIYMGPLKAPNCQSNTEEQKSSRRHNSPRLQTILQSHRHQDSVVLEQKQTYRLMEQNGEPRNTPRYLWSINLQQRRQDYKMGKSLFNSGAGKTGQLHVNQ